MKAATSCAISKPNSTIERMNTANHNPNLPPPGLSPPAFAALALVPLSGVSTSVSVGGGVAGSDAAVAFVFVAAAGPEFVKSESAPVTAAALVPNSGAGAFVTADGPGAGVASSVGALRSG